jgi:hypothetical protein
MIQSQNLFNENYIIIDDFVSTAFQDEVENELLSGTFPWYYNETSRYGGSRFNTTMMSEADKCFLKTENILMLPQFSHMVIDNEVIHSGVYSRLTPFITNIPFSYTKINKIKINLKTKNSESLGKCDLPHVDTLFKNVITAIYYVNDSDGDTILYNENYNYVDNIIPNLPLTINTRIQPKKGRMIFFKGDTLHSAGSPAICNKRLVINWNFLI